jgi:hypothetical protein
MFLVLWLDEPSERTKPDIESLDGAKSRPYSRGHQVHFLSLGGLGSAFRKGRPCKGGFFMSGSRLISAG